MTPHTPESSGRASTPVTAGIIAGGVTPSFSSFSSCSAFGVHSLAAAAPLSLAAVVLAVLVAVAAVVVVDADAGSKACKQTEASYFIGL